MHKLPGLCTKVIFLLFILTISGSCVSVKKLSYFNDINEVSEPTINPRGPTLIRPFDRLYVQVLSIDEKTNLLFKSNEFGGGNSSASMMGYLVDEAGDIYYPIIGKIAVAGLTTVEASIKVEKALGEYVPNASVIIKLIDNSVTVMGEVQRQGVYSFNKDKLNIYEAIALGGGLTKYGNRKNVILIRQEGGKLVHHVLDLSSSAISGKDYFYILSNDVVVVEPMKNLSYTYGNNTYSLILSSISAIITILLFTGIKPL